MPRRIRLLFEENTGRCPCDLLGIVDDVVVTGYVTRPWGTNYTGWSRGHPLSPYYKQKPADPEFLPLHLHSSRVGYRHWLGVVMESQNGLRVPAKALDHFRKRAVEIEDFEPAAWKHSRLLVAGYAMDNMKPLDFAEALLPLIISGNEQANEAIKELAQRWVTAADLVANQLVSTVRRALFGSKGNVARDSTVLDGVRFRFWADTEDTFFVQLRRAAERIEASTDQLPEHLSGLKHSAGLAWLSALKRHAFRLFDETVPIDSADSDRIADVVEGRKFLVLALMGYGSVGKPLFEALSQPAVETKMGKRGKQHEQQAVR
jgi:CRISPR system Cascade subunit CasA